MRFMLPILVALAAWSVPPIGAQDRVATPQDWSGKWRGVLTDIPARAGAKPVDVAMDIGPLPGANHTCMMWRTTYTEGGVVRQVKDYRLCRGENIDDWFIDEGGGAKLVARWMGGALMSSFKVDSFLVIATLRLSRDMLNQEILTLDDNPVMRGIQPLALRSVQRIDLKRAGSAR